MKMAQELDQQFGVDGNQNMNVRRASVNINIDMDEFQDKMDVIAQKMQEDMELYMQEYYDENMPTEDELKEYMYSNLQQIQDGGNLTIRSTRRTDQNYVETNIQNIDMSKENTEINVNNQIENRP